MKDYFLRKLNIFLGICLVILFVGLISTAIVLSVKAAYELIVVNKPKAKPKSTIQPLKTFSTDCAVSEGKEKNSYKITCGSGNTILQNWTEYPANKKEEKK